MNNDSLPHKIPGGEGIESGTLGLHAFCDERNGIEFQRVHCCANPCTIKINEIVIGVTSTDVLFDISADETKANLETNRLLRLSQHLLQQRSYYPLFPGSSNCNQNLKRMDQWIMPCSLDLLILPSKLSTFVHKVLDHTVTINPGHLCRNTTGGTYATIDIHPIQRDLLENGGGNDVEILHNVQDRTKIEVKRI
jgi:DNA polymerase alpha subunit B